MMSMHVNPLYLAEPCILATLKVKVSNGEGPRGILPTHKVKLKSSEKSWVLIAHGM